MPVQHLDRERVRYEIETFGFSVVPDVIDPGAAAALRSDLLAALESDQRSFGQLPGKKYELIQNLAIHGARFLELLDNDVMHDIFSDFLSEHCILYNYSSTVLLPKASSAVQNIHVDSPRLIPGYHDGLIMTLALDDFNDENGATYYLAGSHISKDAPNADTFERCKTSVARPRGAAVFFNPRCFHRGGENMTSTPRCGVTVFGVRPFMKQRFDFPRMIEESAVNSPRLRRFLGFDARIPSSMEEFYVAPEARLYRAGQE